MLPLPLGTTDPNIQQLARRTRETRTGSTSAAWALTNRPIEGQEQVFKNGLLLEPGTDYTIAGTVLTFASAPSGSDVTTAIYYYPAS
jgi:hypothetical protein